MNQVKTGALIAERRKLVGLTQAQLAEQLGITDRAVSKWETGRAMPDASLMLALCGILGITVNDLLCGEVVTMEGYNKELENNLVELAKEKQEADKRLLKIEVAFGGICLGIMVVMLVIALAVKMEEWLTVTLTFLSVVPILVACPFLIRIEQKAGYYACPHCGHRYVPSYKSVFFAPHMGRTRHMKCPSCGRRGWQEKTLTKED